MSSSRPPRILLAATGSVATVKVPEIAVRLATDTFTHPQGAQVRVVLTAAAKHFWERAKTYNPTAWQQYEELVSGQDKGEGEEETKRIEIYEDKHEWEAWDALGDSVVHIDLRAWADILLIAPLSANSLGKIANGLCDNLLTSIVRAWDVKHKPVLLAPAMNTHMWEHPFTARHLGQLQAELGYHVIPPVSKLLACGDTGQGGLAAVDDLVEAVQQVLANEMEMGKEEEGEGKK